MLRIVSTFLFALVLAGTANAQIALPSPGKVLLGAGAAKVCLDHKILCAAAAVGVGAYMVNKVGDDIGAKTRGEADTNCENPSVPIFRAVHVFEYGSIKAMRRYMRPPGGMEVKEFWLSVVDAHWFAGEQDPAGVERTWITRSLACPETVAMGEPFTDVNHRAVAFRQDMLDVLNNEAKRSGGIQTQELQR